MENLTKDIMNAKIQDGWALIRDFEFDSNGQNELLCFLKPECFLAGNTEKIIQATISKFSEHKARIHGILLLEGRYLEKNEIMDRHYGFINKLSKNASTMIGDVEKKKMSKLLELDNLDNHTILGGHEFLAQFDDFDEKSLDSLWAEKKSIKLQGGFYFQKYQVKEKNIILVNAFHPSQLKWFTKSDHKILVFLLKSDNDWSALRAKLAGDTFPEKADPASIRGELFANKEQYGLGEVSIAANCVHLSAGPYEGMFEINNFLKDLPDFSFDLMKCSMAKQMKNREFNEEDIKDALGNPPSEKDDLFGMTEDKNTTAAVEDYALYFKK